jgi:hypothetical protein
MISTWEVRKYELSHFQPDQWRATMKTRKSRVAKPERKSERRISVPGDESVLKKIHREKAETGATLIEIVNTRLGRSYEDHPKFANVLVSA